MMCRFLLRKEFFRNSCFYLLKRSISCADVLLFCVRCVEIVKRLIITDVPDFRIFLLDLPRVMVIIYIEFFRIKARKTEEIRELQRFFEGNSE